MFPRRYAGIFFAKLIHQHSFEIYVDDFINHIPLEIIICQSRNLFECLILFVLVSCVIWDRKNEIRKAELSMLEISSTIIGKVESKQDSMDYFYIGIFFSTILAFLPVICRVINISSELTLTGAHHFLEEVYANVTLIESSLGKNCTVLRFYRRVFGETLGGLQSYILLMFNGNIW